MKLKNSEDKLKDCVSLRADTYERVKRFQVQNDLPSLKSALEALLQNKERKPTRKERPTKCMKISTSPETYDTLASKRINDNDSFDAVINRLLDNGRKTTFDGE